MRRTLARIQAAKTVREAQEIAASALQRGRTWSLSDCGLGTVNGVARP